MHRLPGSHWVLYWKRPVGEQELQQRNFCRKVCSDGGKRWCWIRLIVMWVVSRQISVIFLKVKASGLHLGYEKEKSAMAWWVSAWTTIRMYLPLTHWDMEALWKKESWGRTSGFVFSKLRLNTRRYWTGTWYMSAFRVGSGLGISVWELSADRNYLKP